MQTRQLYSLVSASTAGTVYVELPTKARIKGIQLSITNGTAQTAADYVWVEISTVSANQTATHDAVGVLAAGGGYVGAAGIQSFSAFTWCDCQLQAGERIYLNATEVGSGSWAVRAIIHYT